jgi:REP element-mobilizing transposase RayT
MIALSPEGFPVNSSGCNPEASGNQGSFNPGGVTRLPAHFVRSLSIIHLTFYLGANICFMNTYKQIFYHLVFGTKHRQPSLTEKHQEELYKYIWGIIKKRGCHLYRINGTEDHLHIFSDLHPSVSLADYVKEIKVASSNWIKESGYFPQFTYWQEGYGAFSHSVKERDNIIRYIKNQKEHHKTESFYDEFKRLLIENDIPFEEKYLL